MAVYIITGKLGGGKTLVSVGLIRDALNQGRPIATNVDLVVENLLPWNTKQSRIYRLPDNLTRCDLDAIGKGKPDDVYDEDQNGLVVLDEGGLLLNSRNYKNVSNMDFYKWGLHSRKLGWDLLILIQDFDALDKQVRQSFGEHVVRCVRWDRVRLPYIGWLLQLLGFKGTFAKLHQATCRYGVRVTDMLAWRKWFRGNDLYNAYDTKQVYDADESDGLFMYLTPWHVKGRHFSKLDEIKSGLQRLWNDYANIKLGRLSVFFSAMVLGGWAHAYTAGDSEPAAPVETKTAISVPIAGLTSKDISEAVQDLEYVDPWERVYISGYVGNVKTREYHYSFKDQEGNKIFPPGGSRVVAISACSAIVKSNDQKYFLSCR